MLARRPCRHSAMPAHRDAAAAVVLADAVTEVGAEEVRAPDVGEVDAADEARAFDDEILERVPRSPGRLRRGDGGGHAVGAVERRVARVDPALEIRAVLE